MRIGKMGVVVSAVLVSVASTLDASVGFNVTYTGFTDQQKAAFGQATAIWSSYLTDSYTGEAIHISATMAALPGTVDSAVLGSTSISAYYTLIGGGVFADTWYPLALTNHLVERSVDTSPSITMSFNNAIGTPQVLPTLGWYFGTDGNTPSNTLDFTTVVLHEITHGLGISSSMGPNGTYQISNGTDFLPAVYDQFLASGGVRLVNMTAGQRAAAEISNSLTWVGAAGTAANGGTNIPLFSPSPYQGGSSVSHLDETLFTNDLMSPYYSGVDHAPSPLDLGMLQDIGWSVVPEPTVFFALAAASTMLLTRRRAPRKAA